MDIFEYWNTHYEIGPEKQIICKDTKQPYKIVVKDIWIVFKTDEDYIALPNRTIREFIYSEDVGRLTEWVLDNYEEDEPIIFVEIALTKGLSQSIQELTRPSEEKIKDLKHFVSRFSANASKSRQATSRLKQLDKIELSDIKPSSRVSPYIIFNQSKEWLRNILEVQNVNKSFDGTAVLKDINLMIETGERVAIIGQNGIGKTTLLRTLYGELEADSGKTKWSENANIGYYAQDHNADFEKDISVLDWMTQFKNEKDDIQMMRSVLGKMLFGKEDIKKSVKSLSGGEKGRMIFGRLMLQKPNILLMDEPTNHMDMESIEALTVALDNYEGTLIFEPHDREFVSSLST